MPELPSAVRLVAWGNAALAGEVGLDEAADHVAGREGNAHRVSGLPGEQAQVALGYALGRLRALGVQRLRLVLPRAGDVSGLTGPPEFNRLAVDAGQAVLGSGADLGLVPTGRSEWQVHAIGPVPPPSTTVRDADRELHATMRAATEELVRLEVGQLRPADEAVLGQLGRRPATQVLPPSSPGPAHLLVALAQRLRTVLATAAESDGAAVSAHEIAVRSRVLRDLETATRRALEAACSAEQS